MKKLIKKKKNKKISPTSPDGNFSSSPGNGAVLSTHEESMSELELLGAVLSDQNLDPPPFASSPPPKSSGGLSSPAATLSTESLNNTKIPSAGMMKKVANFGGAVANNLRQRADSNDTSNSGRNTNDDKTIPSTSPSKITDHVLGQTTTKIHTSYKPLALELLNFKDGSLNKKYFDVLALRNSRYITLTIIPFLRMLEFLQLLKLALSIMNSSLLGRKSSMPRLCI